jgi:hypothetical protein
MLLVCLPGLQDEGSTGPSPAASGNHAVMANPSQEQRFTVGTGLDDVFNQMRFQQQQQDANNLQGLRQLGSTSSQQLFSVRSMLCLDAWLERTASVLSNMKIPLNAC